MASRWLCWCFGALALLPGQAARAEWSGYAKSLWLGTETEVGQSEPVHLGINRVRLTWRDKLAGVRVEASYDLDARFGSYVNTDQYRLQRSLMPEPYLGLQRRSQRGARTEVYHGFYRIYAQTALGPADVRVGRQQLNWSRTLLWSSFDRFNPYSPLQLEPEERVGVDALQLVWNFSNDRNLEWAWLPAHDQTPRMQGLRYRDHWGRSDWDFMLAEFGTVQSIGLAGAGQWGSAGWRFEVTHNRETRMDDTSVTYQDLVLGVDHAITEKASLVAELLYRGGGASRPEDYDWSGYLSGRRSDLARRYAGMIARYRISPLIRLDLTVLANLDDGSLAWMPLLELSPGRFENMNLRVGVQTFTGASDTEFGRQKMLAFAEIKWFF
jgi:hypothetical protein